MARYIDADALQRRICGAKCECEYEDCGCEGDCAFDHFISNAPPADVAPRAEVANIICCEIEEEIVAALNSNYRAIAEHQKKYGDNVNLNFLTAVYAKNNALRGMEAFVEELKKKYAEVQK